MERSPEKKPRLDCDPLENLHSDVFEFIFQHLSIKDIAHASLVSKSWYEHTGTSKKCNEKILLKVAEPLKIGKLKQIVLNNKSRRKYQNIELDNISDVKIIQKVKEVLAGRQWKQVTVKNSMFDQDDYCEILQIIADHVEELNISSNFVRDDEETTVPFIAFPKLTKLKLADPAYSRDLFIFSPVFAVTSVLDSISTNGNQLDNVNPDGSQCKLKTFHLEAKGMINERAVSLLKFLTIQADSLETLSLVCNVNSEILELCFQLPKLTDLFIGRLNQRIDFSNLRLHPSQSINKLRLNIPYEQAKLPILNALLRATPQLRHLSCAFLDPDSFATIGSRCQDLEELNIDSFLLAPIERIGNPSYLPNLKRLKCCDPIGNHVIQIIRAKRAAERSPLEKLMLKTVTSNGATVSLD